MKIPAAIDAAVARLRPVLMTTLATSLGALPIALAIASAGKSKSSGTPRPEDNAAAEAISALTNLGYQPSQAAQAVAVAMGELGDGADTAKLIRRGLKELGTR